MIRLRQDISILDMLRDAGYTTYKIRQDKILGERTLQKFRAGELPSWRELDVICGLLHVGPWDIIEYREGE